VQTPTSNSLLIGVGCVFIAQQAISGRVSARLSAVEQNQAEVKRQLASMVMTSQNNEQALKDVNVTLGALAAMVTSIMNKLESKTSVSEPKTTANNQDVHRSAPKSPCDLQDQSPTDRMGTSNTLPADVVDNTSARSEGEGQPITYTRLTRSKDVKLKAVSASQENSQEGVKGRGSEKAMKKGRVAKGGAKKRAHVEVASGQPKPTANASQGDGVVDGGCADFGSGPPEVAVAAIGVEGSGEGGLQGGNKVAGPSGKDVIGVGGSVGVEGGDVAILVEAATLVASPGKGVSSISCPKSPKTMSPSKLGDTGADDNAQVGQVSLTTRSDMSSIADPPIATKLLILNVHGTLLDTSLLAEPNPNPNIRVSKKIMTRRLVYRPWMMEVLGMCFKFFKVAFWGRKSIQYMEEVL
jgi:hypothetical protein